MFQELQFAPVVMPAGSEQLRAEVRAFLADELVTGPFAHEVKIRPRHVPEFSAKLGARGWIGMTWPKQYGGHERSALERYVVTEELVAAGAPVAAHWTADRQSGPVILRFGSEAQRTDILPRIARGECYFSIGMSEPDSGSDLASIRTSARQVDGGWRINGTKLWTSNAHFAHYMITLVRTRPKTDDRHAGMSQFLVDLSSPEVTVRPVLNLAGDHSFNEIQFDDAFVADDMLLGEEGNGWNQVVGELGYERSGPERFLGFFRLYVELVRAAGTDPDRPTAELIGRLAAHLITLRNLSLSVAGMLQAGELPVVEAALVKDLGTNFEKEMPGLIRAIRPAEVALDADDSFERTLARSILYAPSVTIQGGTREILRGVIARGLGLR